MLEMMMRGGQEAREAFLRTSHAQWVKAGGGGVPQRAYCMPLATWGDYSEVVGGMDACFKRQAPLFRKRLDGAPFSESPLLASWPVHHASPISGVEVISWTRIEEMVRKWRGDKASALELGEERALQVLREVVCPVPQPEGGNPDVDRRKKVGDQWSKRHRGWRDAYEEREKEGGVREGGRVSERGRESRMGERQWVAKARERR